MQIKVNREDQPKNYYKTPLKSDASVFNQFLTETESGGVIELRKYIDLFREVKLQMLY